MTQKSITIPLSDEHARQLAKVATARGKPVEELVVEAVQEFLDDNYDYNDEYTPAPPDPAVKARMDELLTKVRAKKAGG